MKNKVVGVPVSHPFLINLLAVLAMLTSAAVSAASGFLDGSGAPIVSLSPDGRHLAILQHGPERDAIRIIRTNRPNEGKGSSRRTLYRRAIPHNHRIGAVDWGGDSAVFMTTIDSMTLIELNLKGEMQIVSIGTEDSGEIERTIALMRGLIVQLSSPDGARSSLWRIDTRSGAPTRLADLPRQPTDVLATQDASVVLAVHKQAGGWRVDTLRSGRWHHVENFPPSFRPVYAKDASTVIAVGRADPDQDTSAVYQVNLTSGNIEQAFRHPRLDVEDVMIGAAGELVGVKVIPGYSSWTYLLEDHPLGKVHRSLVAALSDVDVDIRAVSSNGSQALMQTTTSDRPGDFYVVEVASRSAERIVTTRVEGDAGLMRPISFEARDGYRLHGYMSFPKTRPAALPTVVLVARRPDLERWVWGYDTEIGFLNDQGFSVLLINHRGTRGYGRKHLELGLSNGGHLMYQDIADGVRWAAENGLTAAGQVCIYGRGQGALIALGSYDLEPDLYRCAIGIGAHGNTPEANALLEKHADVAWIDPTTDDSDHGDSVWRTYQRLSVLLAAQIGELIERDTLKLTRAQNNELERLVEQISAEAIRAAHASGRPMFRPKSRTFNIISTYDTKARAIVGEHQWEAYQAYKQTLARQIVARIRLPSNTLTLCAEARQTCQLRGLPDTRIGDSTLMN